MGDLLLRDIPEALKQDLNASAQAHGRSMSEEAKLLIHKGLAAQQSEQTLKPATNAYEDLRAMLAPCDEESEQFAKIMGEIEAQRKADFGRPFSFEE